MTPRRRVERRGQWSVRRLACHPRLFAKGLAKWDDLVLAPDEFWVNDDGWPCTT